MFMLDNSTMRLPVKAISVTLMLFLLLIASASSLTNQRVTTYIDVASQLVIINNEVKVHNTMFEHIKSYMFIVDPQWMDNLSYIGAMDAKQNSLNMSRIDTEGTDLKYEIQFHVPLPPGEIETIHISSVIINYLQSYPKSAKQGEKHFVLFSFNVYYYSTYLTQSQTTYLHLGTKEVLSVDGKQFTFSDNKRYGLQYGAYENLEPFSKSKTIIHYENNSPFLLVERLDRFIKISHWGYISVWERIVIAHTGPVFKGSFERIFQDKSRDTRIDSFVTSLPGDAFEIYLKDEIGLIWSFHSDDSDPRKVNVHIRPRFVLYGGWKTQYEIGYSLPIVNYVTFSPNSEYMLDMRIVDKVFDNMVIKEAEISIILPEGATFAYTSPYFYLENNTNNHYCYFLDIVCREVVSFKKQNLVEAHITNISLVYTYPWLLLLSKPMVIILFLWVMFLLFIIFNRPIVTPPPSFPTKEVPVVPTDCITSHIIPKQEIKHKRKKVKTKSKKF